MNSPELTKKKLTTTKRFITTCIYYIYLHFLSDLMNDWQLLNNCFVNNAILNLEIINWSLTKYENTIIKHILDMLVNQEK